MGETSANILREAWGKSLDKNAKVVFPTQRSIGEVTIITDIQETVDLTFLNKYIIERSQLFVLYQIPINIAFNFNIKKLVNYFHNITILNDKQDKYNTIRFILKNGINYKL